MSESSNSEWLRDYVGHSIEFQKLIIAAVIQKPTMLAGIGSKLETRYFENPDASLAFKAIKGSEDSLVSISNKSEPMSYMAPIIEKIENEYGDSPANIVREAISIGQLTTEQLLEVEKHIKNFIQTQEIKGALITSIEDIDDISKRTEIKERLDAAFSESIAEEDSFGVDVLNKVDISSRFSARRSNSDIVKYPMLWQRMESVFDGYRESELFTYIGPSHSGKSMFLVNVGYAMLSYGIVVVHITLEMAEKVVTQRYDMRIAKMHKDDLHTGQALDRVMKFAEGKQNHLWVKGMPSDVTTVGDIKRYINRLRIAFGINVGCLIVDYADILGNNSRYKEKRLVLGETYRALRNLAVELKIPVITATQMNRSALPTIESGKLLDESFIAESYDIMRTIDAGVTINSSKADIGNNRSMLYVCKNRDGRVGDKINFKIDWSIAMATEDDGSDKPVSEYEY